MEVQERLQSEQDELDAVLRSGIFNRAPNLAKFLQYICDCHFRGEDAQIKEYNIAVEALGRDGAFDQKRDSIVRVEAHRLRKRLSEFYSTDGASRAMRIEIPSGQYAPLFVPNQSAAMQSTLESSVGVNGPAPEASPVLPALVPPPAPNGNEVVVEQTPSRLARYVVLSLVTVAVILLAVFGIRRLRQLSAESVWTGSAPATLPTEYRFIAGYTGSPFRDRSGRIWQPDAFYRGGRLRTYSASQYVQNQPDPSFPRTYREGRFHYDIPLRAALYEVHIYMAELRLEGDAGDRGHSFSVRINGREIYGTDELSEIGGVNRLYVRTVKDISPGKDGRIHLDFTPFSDDAVLNAVEILQSTPGKIRPIRLVARDAAVTDANGAVWLADQYGTGGHLIERRDSVSEGISRMLYESERFGNFVYRLPVPPGKYRLSLFFAETYFGTPIAVAQDRRVYSGGRLFNVFTEGRTLLANFDPAREAGGPNRGIVRTFNDLEPNPQGEIVVHFQPVRNYAEVNAIELIETD